MYEHVSFIHSADLHLDSPFKGLSYVPEAIFQEVKESTFISLEKLIRVAIDKEVDFVLMTGDIFDNETQSIKSLTRLVKAFKKLQEEDIHVYLSYGNHDHVNGRLFSFDFPENIHVFESEQVSHFIHYKQGQPVATIYGFSYQERAVLANKTKEYKRETNTPFHIGMLHGSIASNKDHDVYAPFQISELVDKNFDYWALGHIHKRQELKEKPPIVYPGNLQGRSKKETGEKGCYYVELTQSSSSLEFIPLQHIRFEAIEVDASECGQIQEVGELLEQVVHQASINFLKCILMINITVNEELVMGEPSIFVEELRDLVNDTDQKHLWAIVQTITLTKKVNYNKDELANGQHFIGEVIRAFDDKQDGKYLQPLHIHRQARKFLEPFTSDERKSINEEAEELLVTWLLDKEES
ncbi:metallophosphoesterase family protein [Aquibacillus kalidii]|uniref:metallophosphoesterase family protein n=1 Tax=Aquibacillus kalidii TaxID=2762597 RepID=UPI001645B528|nr:DNA repair exonuclease [Aquibacillus kalidii]